MNMNLAAKLKKVKLKLNMTLYPKCQRAQWINTAAKRAKKLVTIRLSVF